MLTFRYYKLLRRLQLVAMLVVCGFPVIQAQPLEEAISVLRGDRLLGIASVRASSEQPGDEIENTINGKEDRIYHSNWNKTNFPVELEYTLRKTDVVDYLVYHPRPGGGNGSFQQFELWVSTRRVPEYTKIGEYDFDGKGTPSVLFFEHPVERPLGFKFVVKSGVNDFVSCDRMEFFEKNRENKVPENIFTDATCSLLQKGMGTKEVARIRNPFYRALAGELLDSLRQDPFRIQFYEAYPLLEETAKKLKVSAYNSFENPTGIYFTSGERIVVLAGGKGGENLSLRIHCFESGEDHTYALFPGLNVLTSRGKGLGYISYYTPQWQKAEPVKIRIVGGQVNGYFDKSLHKAQEWPEILQSAVCNILDIKGDYVNLAYRVSSLKKHCPEKGRELIDKYDRIVEIQHELMGLNKYNIRPKNHMFAREVEGGLFADGWGAGFAWDCMGDLANPDNIDSGIWCLAHEFGHVNQIRPGLKWVSTTEVTNNIYSVWTRYLLGNGYLNLEHERVNDGDNNHVLGGRFNAYLNYGVVKGEQWLCQRGQDRMEDYENGGDHFVKLCPLWQLQLYYAVAGKGNYWHRGDWFADVAQIVRNTDESGVSEGELQLRFMRNVADVVGEDLSDFFIKAGMLKPIDKDMDDYSRAQLTITREECDELVRYMSRYPKPVSPVIYYLSGNSVRAYQKRLPVEGVYNRGIVRNQAKSACTVSHQEWQNVTVFETYKGNELICAAMAGTDSPDQSSTLVRYPEGATRIEAVAWDGTRTLVYGER